jgi:plasmid replication initiation protein
MVSVLDLVETCNTSDGSTAYTELQEAAERLYKRDINTYDENGRRYGWFHWVQAVECREGQGYVEITLSQLGAPHVALLHRSFRTYVLEQVAQVNPFYAIRIFDLLKQFKTTGVVVIGLEQMRLLLELAH